MVFSPSFLFHSFASWFRAEKVFGTASVDHWLSFRGLHTDRLEGVSADHWLAFRGLPAEGLWDCSHEAASFPAHHGSTAGVLSRMPQEGLSRAEHRVSSRLDGLLVGVSGSSFHGVGNRKNAASAVVGRAFLGTLFVAPPATRSSRSPRQGDGRGSRRARGSHFRDGHPIFFGRGVLVVGTWIFEGFQPHLKFPFTK